MQPRLETAQVNAARTLVDAVGQGFSVTLLDGVTGSGKTEVYLEAVAATLARGQQVLVLVPEIALTSQSLARFVGRFGARPAEWHSDLPGKVRIASVSQETPSLPDAAIDFVLSGDTELHEVMQAEAKAMEAEDWDGVAAAHQRLAEINGYDGTARAGKLLHGLGFPPREMVQRRRKLTRCSARLQRRCTEQNDYALSGRGQSVD